MAKNRF